MARYSGVRIDREWDKLIARLTIDAKNLPVVVEDAMVTAAGEATTVMEARIMQAVTETGHRRVAEGRPYAGRIESGEMIRSLRNDDGSPATVTSHGTASGRTVLVFGYINDPPEYTVFQEYDYYTISGALLAMQRGFNYFAAHVMDRIADAYNDMDDQAKAGRFSRRGARLRSSGRLENP